MKRFPRLSCAAVLAVVLALPSISSQAQQAPEQASHRAAAEELLKAMHTEQILNTTIERMYSMVDKFSETAGKQPGLSDEQIAAAKKAQDEAHAAIRAQMNWDVLKGDAITAYADAFTEAELKQLAEFYQTPAGQKLIEKQPEISEKMGKLSQQRFMAVMPAVIQKIRDVARKNAKPDGTGAPAGPISPTPASTTTPALGNPVSPTPASTPAPANSTSAPANSTPTPPPVPTPPTPSSPASTPTA